ncbi:MAG: hypothetical protein GY729_09405 [Desulfobacteraceae bacterium]|nr:hypothetical protein [Desulfobacteraceae bacterium]
MKLIQVNKDEIKISQAEDLKEKLDGSTILFPMFRALINNPGFSGSERDQKAGVKQLMNLCFQAGSKIRETLGIPREDTKTVSKINAIASQWVSHAWTACGRKNCDPEKIASLFVQMIKNTNPGFLDTFETAGPDLDTILCNALASAQYSRILPWDETPSVQREEDSLLLLEILMNKTCEKSEKILSQLPCSALSKAQKTAVYSSIVKTVSMVVVDVLRSQNEKVQKLSPEDLQQQFQLVEPHVDRILSILYQVGFEREKEGLCT